MKMVFEYISIDFLSKRCIVSWWKLERLYIRFLSSDRVYTWLDKENYGFLCIFFINGTKNLVFIKIRHLKKNFNFERRILDLESLSFRVNEHRYTTVL